MKNNTSTKVMIASFAGVLMFSLGFMPVSYAGISQGTLTINNNCATIVQTQDMDFGTADAGDTVTGFFTVRNNGNEVANIDVDVTTTGGDWVDIALTSIIDASDTTVDDGTLSGALDVAPVTMSQVDPDAVDPGNNDLQVDLSTDVNLLAAFSGDLTLDLTLVNTGCG